jgi:dihydrolipoamide dehydrogenase
MEKFDLIIIGGGPSGYPLALREVAKGKKVALVESESEVGGTCLNWGCIPTKSLLASANSLRLLKNAADFGLACSDIAFDWTKIIARKNQVSEQLRTGVIKLLESKGVAMFKGLGKLYKGRKVRVTGYDEEITADKIALCIGSIPSVPGFFPTNREIFWSSNEALSCEKLPESLLIVGGGVIGMELSQVFNEFGVKVTVVEMMPQILTGLDVAVAKRITPMFKKMGIEILTGKKVESLAEKDGKAVAVIDGQSREFDRVLLSVGRRVNMSFCDGTDIELETERGLIKVNERYETSEEGVYALGDAIKGPMLAHKATYDAMILSSQWQNATNADGKPVIADYSLVPACVFTYPEIAWVGQDEDALKAKGIAYKIGRSMYSANGKALSASEANGQVKVLLSTDNKLLGCVIWGPEAGNIINEATILSSFNLDCEAFGQVIHPHPTLSEVFVEAVENAINS